MPAPGRGRSVGPKIVDFECEGDRRQARDLGGGQLFMRETEGPCEPAILARASAFSEYGWTWCLSIELQSLNHIHVARQATITVSGIKFQSLPLNGS